MIPCLRHLWAGSGVAEGATSDGHARHPLMCHQTIFLGRHQIRANLSKSVQYSTICACTCLREVCAPVSTTGICVGRQSTPLLSHGSSVSLGSSTDISVILQTLYLPEVLPHICENCTFGNNIFERYHGLCSRTQKYSWCFKLPTPADHLHFIEMIQHWLVHAPGQKCPKECPLDLHPAMACCTWKLYFSQFFKFISPLLSIVCSG